MIENIKLVFNNENIFISDKVLNAISTELINRTHNKSRKISNHITFIINQKTNEIIFYGFNIFYQTESFPFSIHSEINTITKYYKKNIVQHKSKKKLIVFKITKNGKLGNSKPCRNCATFIFNNIINLNVTNVSFSTEFNTLEQLNLNDFDKNDFKIPSSSIYRCRMRANGKQSKKSKD